jgi:hypothetical protein
MQRRLTFALTCLIVFAAFVLPSRLQPAFATPSAGKTVCHTVTKKVNGTTRKVQVCHKVKTKATPVPAGERAHALAGALSAASTDAARSRAVLAILKAFHLGVYTSGGRRILAGSERSARDLYLYDFEVTAIVTQLDAGKRISLDTLAALLAHAGFTTPRGAPLDATTLQTVLRAAVQNAVNHPAAKGVLEPLLLRQLGFAHATPNDLASSPLIELDALQFALIAADLFGTLHASAAFRRSAVDASRRVVLGRDDCDTFLGDLEWTLNWFASRMRDQHMTTQIETGTLMEEYHGDMVGTVGLETDVETPNGLETHYGPAGHTTDAGKPLIYRIHVVLMTPSLNAPMCGSLADLHLPPPGPLRDVLVTMDTGGLEKYGTVEYSPSDRHTTMNGVVQMTFTPQDEAAPDVGQVVTSSDVLSVSTSFHAYDVDQFGQYLDRAGADPIPIHWSVSRHAPHGFKFDVTVRDWHDEDTSGESGECTVGSDPHDCGAPDWYQDSELSGSVCGEDPYTAAWNVHLHLVDDDTSDGPGGLATVDYSFQVALPRGQTTPSPIIADTAGTAGIFGLTLMPGSGSQPLQLRLDDRWGTLDPTLNVTQPTVAVPVVEDTSCPAPTP